MKNLTYWALGVLVGLIIIGVCYMIGKPSSEHVETAESPGTLESMPEQTTAGVRLKAPPSGETFATGYWDGDTWHRTAPPAPETVMYEGEAMTLEELRDSAWKVRGKRRPWSETVAILNRVIAEDPYSERAYYLRTLLATHDENGETIWDDAVLFERLQPLLAYHPDSPNLLELLLRKGWESYPEAAIHYGTEALKYAEMYRMNSNYGAFPESIHHILGFAYQQIGDYSKALAHHRKSVELIRAYPGRMGPYRSMRADIPQHSIDKILSGNPGFGPLSQKERVVDSVPVVAPVVSDPTIVTPVLPSVQPGELLSDVHESADDVSDARQSSSTQDRDVARQQAAAQLRQQAAQRHQQEAQRFDAFVRELHQLSTLKTEDDFEKFLTQKLVKQLQGAKTDTRTSVSAERMQRASQIFRRARTPAEGFKALQKADPDLAKRLQQVR